MDTAIRCDASFQNRKKIVQFAIAAIALIAAGWLVFAFTHAASAEFKRPVNPDDSDIKVWFDDIAEGMANSVGHGIFDAVDEIANPSHAGSSDVAAVMTEFRNQFDAEGSLLYTVGDAVSGLALVLSFFYAFIAVIKELQRGEVNVDMWLKYGIILGVAAVLIFNWHALAKGLSDLGSFLADKVRGAVTDDAASFDKEAFARWYFEKFGFGEDTESIGLFNFASAIFNNIGKVLKAFGNLVLGGIVWFIFQIPLIGIRVTLFAMVLEIYVRRAFIPLAIADVGGNGGRSAGVAYLKSYFGLYIRIGMCYMIAVFAQQLIGTSLEYNGLTFWSFLPKLIIVYIVYKTALKLFQSTSKWADLVVGR